jgi:NADH dehydrogenase
MDEGVRSGDGLTQGRRRRVVIVGGGFGGLSAARTLGDTPCDVTLVDRVNHHLFQPLLYQVATAVLNAGDIAIPLRSTLRAANVTVLMGEVQSIDLGRKVVVTDDAELPFDDLILATGSSHSYFGNDDWARHAPGLKTVDDALEIRRRVLLAFEQAERESDPVRRRAWLTFVVVGGGPTGVELAGALAEISRHSLRGEFRRMDPAEARILLVEGLPRILTAWPEDLSERARRDLARRGVEVRTQAMVTSIDDHGLSIGDERIGARTVLWAAGVQASPLGRALGAPLDRAGRVRVTPQLTLPGRDDVFVVGDLASVEVDGRPVPGLAPAAIQQGRAAAENILRKLRGAPLAPFEYRDRGSFAVVGRSAAVGVAFKKKHMTGVVAWLVWLGVHIAYLVGFRNRVSVLLRWAYVYFTQRRPTRLITGGKAPPREGAPARPGADDRENRSGDRPAPRPRPLPAPA